MRALVIWQSLVVPAYRSFFERVAVLWPCEMTLVSPRAFRELGDQVVRAGLPEASGPGEDSAPRHPGAGATRLVAVRTFARHPQVVFFTGLTRVFRMFLPERAERPACATRRVAHVFALVEPYSPSFLFLFPWLAWARARGARVHLYGAQNVFKRYAAPLRLIQALAFRTADDILVCGREQAEVLRRHGFAKPCVPFPLWFDSTRFKPLVAAERDLVLARSAAFDPLRAASSEGRWRIGFAGRLAEEKGVADFLAAARSSLPASSRHAGAAWFLAGDGPLREDVWRACAQARAAGIAIHPLGTIGGDSMPAYFAALDVLVVPSLTRPHWKEQFGRVIVEAQACGCLVVGSRSGEIPHVLGDDDLVFEEGNVPALLTAVDRALERLEGAKERVRGGVAARARETYSDEATARAFVVRMGGVA